MHTRARFESVERHRIWKGAVAGLIGGLIASWTMNQFQAVLAALKERTSDSAPKGDDATVKVAKAVSESVAAHRLTPREKKAAGPVVHYAFGSAMGALYGVASVLVPSTARGWGLPFGAALWFGADEVAVPAAGLSQSSGSVPASVHASALAAHLVYGGTVEAVRRLALPHL